MGKWQMNALSTEKRIIAIFNAAALASIVLVSGGLNFFLRRTALADAQTNLKSMAFQLGKHCDSTINEARLDLELMSRMPAFKQLSGMNLINPAINGIPDTVDPEKWQFFQQMMKKSDGFSTLFVLQPNGDVYLVYPFEAQKKLMQTNFADKKYYQDALRTKKTVISDAFVSAGGNLSAAILVPLSDDAGKTIGYLGGGFRMQTLAGLMTTQEIAPFDFATLIDRQGKSIVSNYEGDQAENADESMTDRNPIIPRFISLAPGSGNNGSAMVLVDEYYHAASRKQYLEGLYPLDSGWGLCLMKSKPAILNEVGRVIRGMTAITVLVMFLICGIGIFLAHRTGRLWSDAEMTLRQSEDKFRYFFDHSSVGKSLTLPAGGIQVNEKMCEMLGYTSEELYGKKWNEITHPDDVESTRKEMDRLMNGEQESARFTKRYICKDGHVLWADVLSSIRRDQAGNPLYFMTSIIDITDQKKIKDNLSQSEQKYRLLVSQMMQGLAVHEMIIDGAGNAVDYRFLDMNESFERLTGLKRENIINKTVLEVLPETEKYWIDMYGHVAMTGEPVIFENYSKELDKYYEISAYSTQPGQFAVIMADATERINSANELKRTKEYLEKLIDHASASIVVWNAKQEIMLINRAFEKLIGRNANQVVGKELHNLFSEKKMSEALIYASNRDAGETPEAAELDIEDPGGAVHTVLWNTAAIYDNDGKNVISVIAQGQDITDRKKAEDKLIHQNQHDYLTGMYNRQFFEEELERLDVVGNLPLSVIIFDVNGLKLINDSFGHLAGDALLKKTSDIILKNCLAGYTAARLGGDEFAMILPWTDSEKTAVISKHIKENAQMEKIENIGLSISYGYDTKTSGEKQVNELLANAENHMYRHKIYERSSLRSKTIDIIMKTLFEKSNREMMHSRRVSEICRDIAAHLDFSEADMNKIKTAGLIHDIGKIGIDERILNKDQSLNPDEWEQMKKHPEAGWRILGSVAEFSDLSQFILCHHEKWDGSGYPNGLKQEEIPLEARIIAIADAYDAMTIERSYRKAFTMEDAKKEIRRCSGTQFDPNLVDVFLDEVLSGASGVSLKTKRVSMDF